MDQAPVRPPRLRPGDRVALVAPAGPIEEERIEAAVNRCHALGFEPVLGEAIREQHGYLAGPDAVRAGDMQSAIEDGSIAAIWAIRGGYGSLRTLPHLDLSILRSRPKAFIGLSDNTAVHLALARQGIVSFHGPHAGVDAFPPETETAFRRVLMTAEPAGVLPMPADTTAATLVEGTAEGPLIGGNLALLAATCGTPYALQSQGRIVLIEDIGEPVFRIDRMLMQLRLSGVLDGAAAIAFGAFTDVLPARHHRPLKEVLREWVEPLGIPAVLGLPFGHLDHNWTLPIGIRARLDAGAGTIEILEAAVA